MFLIFAILLALACEAPLLGEKKFGFSFRGKNGSQLWLCCEVRSKKRWSSANQHFPLAAREGAEHAKRRGGEVVLNQIVREPRSLDFDSCIPIDLCYHCYGLMGFGSVRGH